MAARTQLTPVQLTQDGAVSEGAGTAIAGLVADGAYVASPPGPNKILVIVDNSYTAAVDVTLRAGGSGNDAAGNANPGVPFESAALGDLVVSVPASGTYVFWPATTDRFTQADGSMSIDFGAGMTGTIWVLELTDPAV